ncbi:hypothetical protein ABFS82_11G016700 [Erythranthe guttata]|nr:PREDICTED: putative disease resistance RPP13-like protein 1 [Erythranthe guttata]|eukprot:XP_012857422.1 PREDICTED: putative disease resistance RPP13-like protein 1 [Erythranthe guttata]
MGDSSFASGFKTGFGSAFLQFALERFATFGSFAWKEIGVIWGVEAELRKLHRTFLKARDLVDHIDGSPFRFSGWSSAWQMWFEDMRKLAYDADALLDRVSLHLSNYCAEQSENNAAAAAAARQNQVFSMVLSSFKFDLPREISAMQKKLEELLREMESLNVIEKAKFDAAGKTVSTTSRSTASFVDDRNVVGRVRDKACLVHLLTGECDVDNFSVIPLVGMCGLGKTTLARLVFDDDTVSSSFGKKMWVSISTNFDAVRITKSIIECVTLSPCNLSDLYSLQKELRNLLRGVKFLLVLDDYWSEKHDDWDILCSPFRFGSKDSKIVVTTRSAKVSSIVSFSEAYRLKILSDDDCWEVIKQRAATGAEARASTVLESIGKQIATKCKGLPLVATALGNMLRRKCTEQEWSSVLETELWDLPHDKNVFPALLLSYLNLPPHLQKCFAYCSLFPKDHEFDVDELVLLWMAEGFIQPIGARRLEDLGSEYFNDLHSASLFERCGSTSNRIIYKMHDLIHDMARVVSRDACCRVKYSMLKHYPLFGNACHFSLLRDGIQPSARLQAYQKNERLRTFLVISNNITTGGVIDRQLFLYLQCLRVLDLSRLGLNDLPDSVDRLEYLRYLNLSENRMFRLPESMCKLVALQTLKLKNCSQLIELPQNTRNLSNLRHLELDTKGQLQCMPLGFGRLTSLQTLSTYVVGRKKGHGIEELKDMDCLRGSLCIKNIQYVSNATSAEEAKLGMKTCLNKLELQWIKLPAGSPLLNQRMSEQAQVLANLQPHGNVRDLVIQNYCGVIYPNWLSESWRKFTSIHLQGLKYCDSLPSLGQLPSLKSFAISDMPLLQYVDDRFYGTGNHVKFPSLESFQLHGMSMLIQWRNASNADMPCLNSFTIEDCPNLISCPTIFQTLVQNSNIARCPLLRFP